MLGNSRRTIDIDVYIEEKESDLKSTIEDTANELRIFVDVIPINEFTKIPGGAADRHIFLEKVGALEVVVFDPYTIAISKLSRGYADDISDVVFMIQKNYVQLEKLTQFVEETIPVAWDYDDDPEVLKNSLLIVEKTIK